MNKYLLLTCLFFLSSTAAGKAPKNPKLDSLEMRIKSLEDENKLLEERVQSIREDYTLKSKNLEDSYINKNESFKNEVIKENRIVLIISGLLALIGVVIIIQFFWAIRRSKRELAKRFKEEIAITRNKYVSELAEILDKNERKIQKLVDNINLTWKVRGEIKIGVISTDEDKFDFWDSFLSDIGFINPKFFNIEEALQKDLEVDVIAFDNFKNEFKINPSLIRETSLEKIKEFKEQHLIPRVIDKYKAEKLYFYYNENRVNYPTDLLPEGAIMTYANSSPAIYHNLLDLAVFWKQKSKNK